MSADALSPDAQEEFAPNEFLHVSNVTKEFPSKRGKEPNVVFDGLDFRVGRGEFVCIIGPSGCGKTTVLRCMCGLTAPTSGQIILKGEPVRRPRREMALVFQEYGRALMPWMSVRKNVEFPLRRKVRSRAERRTAVESALAAVGLSHALELYPWQLSGGMQQRVAIARALAYQPEILLMDEPFGSVDAQTREDLEDLLLQLKDEFGITVVVVTHDIDEAIYLGERVIVLSSAPTRVRDVIDVPLAHPRSQVTTKEDPKFGHLRSEVYQLLKGGKEGFVSPFDSDAPEGGSP